MDKDTSLPAWIIFLLIALGVAFAVGIALLLTQFDALQQRTLLPQATLPVIDMEATMVAGDLTVVVIAAEDLVTSTPTLIPETPETITAEPTSVPVLIATCAAVPDGWTQYIVQEGDTLTTLSIRVGIDVYMLLQSNCLTQIQLLPGQIILLPSFLTPTVMVSDDCDVPSDWIWYIVMPGDTVASLAQEHHITVPRLMQANCLEDTQIFPGRELFLPPGTDTAPPAHGTPRSWPMAEKPTVSNTPTPISATKATRSNTQ